MKIESEKKWISIRSLKPPFNDAYNYKSKEEKDLFNKIFLRTDALSHCLDKSVYFLIGEKGAGKTAYAVYLDNNVVDSHRCQITTMTETQYKRFIQLKKNKQLEYSDYANIWRSMLLFLVGRMLVMKSKGLFDKITGRFRAVEAGLEQWIKNAMNPEIEGAFEAVFDSNISSSLGVKGYAHVSSGINAKEREQSSQLRHHLLDTENALKESIYTLKISNPHVLFIDGVDYRPEGVSYHEYIECIKGLAEAVWQLNVDFFKTIKDSKGRIKIVLLVRPDVFHSLNLYNSNSRIRDNAVFLDWSTNENEYGNSKLFELSGKYFSTQNKNGSDHEEGWRHYCESGDHSHPVFKRLLKSTFQKPRDVLTFIKLAKDLDVHKERSESSAFDRNLLNSPKFTRRFSEYLLGETKNYAAFYMTQSDFNNYLKFFQYLHGKNKFSFSEFSIAYDHFIDWAKGEHFDATEYLRDAEALLQFFYNANIIGYSETTENGSENYYHWSFRERSLIDIAPKVKSSATLMINPGISKALDIGRSFKPSVDTNRGLKRKDNFPHRGRRRRKKS